MRIGETDISIAGFGDVRPVTKGRGVVQTWRVADSHCPMPDCHDRRRPQRRRLFGLIAGGVFCMRWAVWTFSPNDRRCPRVADSFSRIEPIEPFQPDAMLKVLQFFRRSRDLPFTVPTDAQAPWQSEELGELSLLRRALVVMRPRQPYAAWVAATQSQPGYTVDMAREHDSLSFLIPTVSFDNEETAQFVTRHWSRFFAQGLLIWESDQDRWPSGRTQAMFRQWFELTFCDQVLDLGGYPDSHPRVEQLDSNVGRRSRCAAHFNNELKHEGSFMSNDVATACGIGVCIVIAPLAYLFHDTLGLTPKTAVTTAVYIFVLGSAAGALWFFSTQSHDGAWFGPGNLWPFLLALLVMCWFPALDEWSMTWGTSIPSIVAYSDARFAQDPQWWATARAKFLWFMIPLAGGYGWKYWDAMR